jgi:hypothetical protein
VGKIAAQIHKPASDTLQLVLQPSVWLRFFHVPLSPIVLFSLFAGASGCRKTSIFSFSPSLLPIFAKKGLFFTGAFKGEPLGLAISLTPASLIFLENFPPHFLTGPTFFNFPKHGTFDIFRDELRAILQTVGQPQMKGAHGFRRFFASCMAVLGCTVGEIARWLGHTREEYARPYIFEFLPEEKELILAQKKFFDFQSSSFPWKEKPPLAPPKRQRGAPSVSLGAPHFPKRAKRFCRR